MRMVALTSVLGACAWGGGTDSHGVRGIDARVPSDARPVDGMKPMGDAAPPVMKHLLLTEICLGPAGAEFIEITNPSNQAVALQRYFLADIGDYWKVPIDGVAIGFADFVVKFPDGAMLPAGATITVAIGTAANFMTAYTKAPDYAITGGTMVAVSVGTTPTLTDAGEIVVLFQWDGTASLVKDVDMMIAGTPTVANSLVSKSEVMVGTGTYAADAESIKAQLANPGAGQSTKRIALEGTLETHSGMGNGITGDDETSENTAMTWDVAFTPPTPGAIPML